MASKSRLPTIADVAHRAEISIATVSRVLASKRTPALTTVPASIEAVRRQAVRQLVRLMNGGQAQALT